MNLLPSQVREFLQTRALLGLLFVGAGILAGVAAGAAAMAAEEAVRSRPAGSTQGQAAKEASLLEEPPLKLEELALQEERGQTTVRMKFSNPAHQYRHFVLTQPSRVVVDIFGQAKRQARAENFSAETHWLSRLRLSSNEGYLRVVMDIAAATVPSYAVEPENGGLKVVLGAVNLQHTAKKDLQLVQNGKRLDVRTAEAAPAAGSASPPAPGAKLKAEKIYTGQRLSLDFKDADIKNVFRLLGEVSGLNIVVTDEVRRRVTVRLVDVPWDQVLDLLIDTNGLGKEQVGNVVRISTADQLRRERDTLVAAKKSEENLLPLETAYFSVNYAKVKDLAEKVKPALSKRPDASIVADERSNTLIVRDIRKGVEEATAVVSRLDTRTPQVLIESNLIETTPTFARALGVEFGFTFRGATFTSKSPAGSPFVPGSGATSTDPAVPQFGMTIDVANRFGPFKDIKTVLTAAETEGKTRIISRPSVITLNNVASTIQSLQIVRVLLPTSTNIATGTGGAAGAAVATEKIPVGIILTVTPQVSSDGFILMNISVKSSTITEKSSGGGAIGDEFTREAISNVLIRDGETIVLGGILRDEKSHAESGVPWLKNIPVLGWLFKNVSWKDNFNELMVFITPRIIAAGSEDLPKAEQLWRDQMSKTQGG